MCLLGPSSLTLLAVLHVSNGFLTPDGRDMRLDETFSVVSLQNSPRSIGKLLETPIPAADQTLVTIRFTSMARWPDNGECEDWLTIPLGKEIDVRKSVYQHVVWHF